MPALVRTGASTGGTSSGTVNGLGSFALLVNNVPVEPSPEHAYAPKGSASATPPASPSFRNSLRENSIRCSPLPSRGHSGPRSPGDEEASQENQQPIHGV